MIAKGKELWHGTLERVRSLRSPGIREVAEPITYTPEQIGLNLKGGVRGFLRQYAIFDDTLLSSKLEDPEANIYIERFAARLLHYTLVDNAKKVAQDVLAYLSDVFPVPYTPLPGEDPIEIEFSLDSTATDGAISVINEAKRTGFERELKESIVHVLQGKRTYLVCPYNELARQSIHRTLRDYRARWEDLPARDEGGVGNVDVVEAKE